MTAFDDIIRIAMPYAARAANGDDQAGGEMIEALATVLGRVIARVADGDSKVIDELCTGAEGYIHCEAVSTAEMVRAIKALKPVGRQ